MAQIVLPYEPRAIWKTKLHSKLASVRYAVIVAHRRFGKTIGMVNHIIRAALEDDKLMPVYALIGPYRNQMKRIAWEPLKYYTNKVPGRIVNNTDMYIEFPSKHAGAAGARIYIVGADNPDSYRGTYLDGCILDEYADMDKRMWTEIVFPQLQDRKGFCYFIGTPKGPNHFYDLYRTAQKDIEESKAAKKKSDWYVETYPVTQTGIFTEDEIDDFKKVMSDVEFAQEYMCDFSQAAENDLFSVELLDKAFDRKLKEEDIPADEPIIGGGDIARYGDDSTVLFRRKGFMAMDNVLKWKNLNTMEVADKFINALEGPRDKIDMLFCDVGNMGAGVIDRVQQLGYYNISEVAFQSAAAENKRYENIRAEMYFKLKEWLEKGGALPDVEGLKEELSKVQYKYSRLGRLMLTPKEEIKDKLGRSPDTADALALTFARPVALKSRGRGLMRNLVCNTDYCIMDSTTLYS